MTIVSIIALLVLIGILTLVSYVDSLYAEMGKFLSREFQENIEAFENRKKMPVQIKHLPHLQHS